MKNKKYDFREFISNHYQLFILLPFVILLIAAIAIAIGIRVHDLNVVKEGAKYYEQGEYYKAWQIWENNMIVNPVTHGDLDKYIDISIREYHTILIGDMKIQRIYEDDEYLYSIFYYKDGVHTMVEDSVKNRKLD